MISVSAARRLCFAPELEISSWQGIRKRPAVQLTDRPELSYSTQNKLPKSWDVPRGMSQGSGARIFSLRR